MGSDVIDRTLQALRTYHAQVPIVVSLGGFTDAARERQRLLLAEGIPLQLWDAPAILDRTSKLPVADHAAVAITPPFELRAYQEDATSILVNMVLEGLSNRALIVMATGLGKTVVAAETVRRLNRTRRMRVLAVAHTNDLVYQLERAFWPFLTAEQRTLVWNGYEKPPIADLDSSDFVFACLPTIAPYLDRSGELSPFDILIVDECHHVGPAMYESLLRQTRAGEPGGPFLLGLTATPWRQDAVDISARFGPPAFTMDLVAGMRRGFLANVDYRMYTDNIDWERLSSLHGRRLTPKSVNRTIFVSGWNDAVVLELKSAWTEQASPRGIVFCGTIQHALRMTDRINALGFCRAAALLSQTATGAAVAPYERNRILSDFDDGQIQIVCTVDIFNEGVDVPDVNIIVFQRVTHSRRIFVQQLGRGLRLSPGKRSVIVLDFVSDIRRFAAGLELKDQLGAPPRPGELRELNLRNVLRFRRVGGEDDATETFLRQWLEDVAAVEGAGEDASVLRYPPVLPGARA